MEDVVMTDVAKEEQLTKEVSQNPLYQEYKRVLIGLDKAVTLKDTKSLYLYSRLLNKFRRGFTDEDLQFICDTFFRQRYQFASVSSLDSSLKVIV